MAEQLSNLGVSTIVADISPTDTTLTVLNALPFPTSPNFRLRIETELLLCTAVAGSVFTVTRGIEDTVAAAHSAHLPIYCPLTRGALLQLLADNPGITPNQAIGAIWAEFENYGAPLVAGMKVLVQVNFNCTILANTVITDAIGSIVIQVRKCTYTQYDGGATHPVAGDSINAATPPTVTASDKSTDSTLTGWNTTVSATELIEFYITSVSGLTYANILLGVTKP